MSVLDVLEQLERTSGKLDKRAILEANRDDELLLRMFVAVGDPYVVYNVAKFAMPKPRTTASRDDDAIVRSFLQDLLPQLSSRELTGNAAKEFVGERFADMTERQQKWCQRILLKNLRCGVDTTVNKVWPGAIRTFDVQLAETLASSHSKDEGVRILDEVKYPVQVEPKLDGLRCVAVKSKGKVTLFTRSGNEIDTLPRIKAALEVADYDDLVLDGEAIASDWNETASIVMANKTAKDDATMRYRVFDSVPLADWLAQNNSEPFSVRAERLLRAIGLEWSDSLVTIVRGAVVQSEMDLLSFYERSMNDGYEGVMVKDLAATYKFKRSKDIRKLKPIATYEGVVIGHYEGLLGRKREGMFGGFHVLLPNGIVTKVGGGFTDALKAEVQADGPDSYVGRVVECECQPDPTTADGLTRDGKMRFPVFCRYRDPSDVDQKVLDAYESWKDGQ